MMREIVTYMLPNVNSDNGSVSYMGLNISISHEKPRQQRVFNSEFRLTHIQAGPGLPW